MLTTSPETSPPFFTVAAPTTTGQMMPEGYFYYPHQIPLVSLEPVCYMESTKMIYHPIQHQEILQDPSMEEEIDVETVEESIPAADLLKLRLESEPVPSCSYSSSYTNLEPIRPPSVEASSSKAASEVSSSVPETFEHSRSSDEDDLSRYTPRSRLRQIEEHGQYDSSRDQDRKFKCQYCHKRFVRKEEKLRHERSHTNDRKYKCRICHLRFLRADHRKGHEETHSDIKRFKCDPCNKSFRRKDEYNRHCQRKICKANKVKKEENR